MSCLISVILIILFRDHWLHTVESVLEIPAIIPTGKTHSLPRRPSNIYLGGRRGLFFYLVTSSILTWRESVCFRSPDCKQYLSKSLERLTSPGLFCICQASFRELVNRKKPLFTNNGIKSQLSVIRKTAVVYGEKSLSLLISGVIVALISVELTDVKVYGSYHR